MCMPRRMPPAFAAPRSCAGIAGLLLALSALALPARVPAKSWHIEPDGSGEAATLQLAMAAAAEGDTLVLGAGVFRGAGNRDLDGLGKSLVIRSSALDPAACIIDCEGSAASPHRGLLLLSGEGTGFVLEAVTIMNGYAGETHDRAGGAMIIGAHASPVVRRCRFRENRALNGGAVMCARGSPMFEDCVFEENHAWAGGGALAVTDNSFPLIEGCTFAGNVADNGGAVSSAWSLPVLRQCTLVRNQALLGAGISSWYASTVMLENCLIVFSPLGRAVVCEGAGALLSCCDVFGNSAGDWAGCISGQGDQEGNLSADPLFCDLESGDYGLDQDSPCASRPGCGLIGAWGVACASTGAESRSWGGLKALFR
ncbi:MAG: right-handed parallel beta-helix repeat-containing protein [Candidatus Eisenbacteria bacterium]